MRLTVIEDQPVIRALVTGILRTDGHDVADFAAALPALDSLDRRPAPDAILLDWLLPDLPGEQVLERLMRNPSNRCLIVSGYPLEMRTFPPAWRDRLGLLEKPFTPRMLADALAQLVSGAVIAPPGV
jgi:CheY-like chemotaxis protein